MSSYLNLEPIKTALAAGDFKAARAERLRLFRDLIDDLADGWDHEMHITNPRLRQQCKRLAEQADALGIPEEP